MQALETQERERLDVKKLLRAQVMDFISAGIGCNCLTALSASGLLDKLIQKNFLSNQEISQAKNPYSLKSIMTTLEKCGVLIKQKTGYSLSDFGAALCEYSGLITMLFDGYAKLMSHQGDIVNNEISKPEKFINGQAVSKAAVDLAINAFDPYVLKAFSEVNCNGTVCDLGCGYGRMLDKICRATNNPGLGFDNEPKVVHKAQKLFKDTNVSIEVGDITKLKGVWEDVTAIIQCHVFHDFFSEKKCLKIMEKLLINFPNMRYFFYIDTVAPSNDSTTILPGFDYVHGLLKIQPRTYEETMSMFNKSDYAVLKETVIDELPNTYLWLLSPKHLIKRGKNELNA